MYTEEPKSIPISTIIYFGQVTALELVSAIYFHVKVKLQASNSIQLQKPLSLNLSLNLILNLYLNLNLALNLALNLNLNLNLILSEQLRILA